MSVISFPGKGLLVFQFFFALLTPLSVTLLRQFLMSFLVKHIYFAAFAEGNFGYNVELSNS